MIRRTAILLALLGLSATACVMDKTQEPVAERDLDGVVPIAALEPFDECGALLEYVKDEAIDRVGPYGLEGQTFSEGDVVMEDVQTSTGEEDATAALPATDEGAGGAAPREGEDYSGTNNQEAGVDEADLVKTDGERVLVAINGELQLLDTTTAAPAIIKSITLPAGYSHELFLAGDRVLVIGEADPYAIEELSSEGIVDDSEIDRYYDTSSTMLVEVDISGEQSMEIVSTQFVEGSYLSARAVDGTARIVLSTPSQQLDWVQPTGPRAEAAAEAANRELVEESEIEDWLPSVTTVDGDNVDTQPVAPCDQVSRPAEFSGFGSLTVLSVDLEQPLADTRPVTIMADGETVYASPDTLYVATTEWVDPAIIDDGDVDQIDDRYSTAIHSFDISSDGPAAYRASGAVRGHLLNQFAMSEFEDTLRVASTDGSPWGSSSSESFVTTFQESEGQLQQVGQVGDMGKGEEIFSVRFVDDTAYVVTFEQTDPLYTLDLSDPASPTVVGELKILGYSAYLHPLGDGLLLGVGQDATEDGATLGTQVSLFDVSDPANPTRVQQYTLADSSSDVEYDHRAFLYWADQSLAVLPVQDYLSGFSGAIGLDIGTDGIAERGRISHGAGTGPIPGPSPCPPDALCAETLIEPTSYASPILRSLVVGDQVWTVSSTGVAANDLVTLADEGFVSF